MTPNTNDRQTDSRPATTRLTAELLDQWRAESRDFFSNARRKLQQVREAERAARHSHSPIPLDRSENEPRVMQESPAPAFRESEERESRENPGLSLRAPDDAPAVNQVSPPVADDSSDRLQAIKRRLAAQLENSRS